MEYHVHEDLRESLLYREHNCDNCEKGDHQAVGCYHQGNVSGPVGKLGRGLLEASNIQTNTFTFNLK